MTKKQVQCVQDQILWIEEEMAKIPAREWGGRDYCRYGGMLDAYCNILKSLGVDTRGAGARIW